MASDAQWSGPGVTFRIDGLNRTLRALSAAGADAADMRDLMHSIGMLVVDAARPQVPVKSGRLRDTIRAGRGKTKAVVRAGSGRVPYAGPQEYGWPARNITAHHFLTDALDNERQQVFRTLDEGISQLLRQHRLR